MFPTLKQYHTIATHVILVYEDKPSESLRRNTPAITADKLSFHAGLTPRE
jgi:hypothetical protein